MRRLAVSLLALLVALPAAAPAMEEAALFIIERSVNRNRVAYEWQPGSRPIRAYWLLEAGGTEELTALEERFAYGVSLEWSGDDAARFTIRPLPDRPIEVRRAGPGRIAVAEIGGVACKLDSVWVEVASGLLPGVEFVELRGRAVAGGAPCWERIEP